MVDKCLNKAKCSLIPAKYFKTLTFFTQLDPKNEKALLRGALRRGRVRPALNDKFEEGIYFDDELIYHFQVEKCSSYFCAGKLCSCKNKCVLSIENERHKSRLIPFA